MGFIVSDEMIDSEIDALRHRHFDFNGTRACHESELAGAAEQVPALRILEGIRTCVVA